MSEAAAPQDRSNLEKLDSSELAARLGAWSGGKGPLYMQLAAGLTTLLDQGAIRSGTLLPPERRLAERLAVSRGTVVNAYGLLDRQGWLRRVQGRGTIVTGPSRSAVDRSPLPDDGLGPRLFDPALHSIDLLAAVPHVLPEVLEVCQNTNLVRDRDIIDSAEPAGIDPLRRRIAQWYGDAGLTTTPEQIVVTSGAQQALSLSVDAICRPGDVALVEAMTWPGLLDVIRATGARVHAVPMDDHGIIVDELEAMVRRLRPRLLAVNPHNQNPTGTRLPDERRRALADVCAEYGATVVEDRVGALINFDRRLPPPLAVHRPDGGHVTIDSLNKLTWPGLRIGWIRTDLSTVGTLRAAKALNDLYSSIPSQLMALDLLEDLDRLEQIRRNVMIEQADALMGALRAELDEWEFHPPRGGVVLWVELPGGRATAFAHFARSHGVSVASSADFTAGPDDDRHLRLPFTSRPEILRTAVGRLANAWRAFGDETVPSAPHNAPAPSII